MQRSVKFGTMVQFLAAVVALTLVFGMAAAKTFMPKPNVGLPAGFLPECPGVMKNATISTSMMPLLKVTLTRLENGILVQKSMPVSTAARTMATMAKDKKMVFKNKKMVLYAVGYLDSAVFPQSRAVGNSYLKRGYNVFLTDTINFLTDVYPKSVRVARVIGRKLGEFLVKMSDLGVEPENLELVGISLGAHIAAFAAKHYFAKTGKKPSRITGLDPSGPCFRALPTEYRLNSNDAHYVDILHTNIDGFGIAEPLGHVDFYANGGEYQPGDIPSIPCLIICSHIKSILYWWQALEHPKKFIGLKCDSVQDARVANCYNSTVRNYLGLETKFDRQGIYYLPTFNEFPYYYGKEGLKPENEVYKYYTRSINAEDFMKF